MGARVGAQIGLYLASVSSKGRQRAATSPPCMARLPTICPSNAGSIAWETHQWCPYEWCTGIRLR